MAATLSPSYLWRLQNQLCALVGLGIPSSSLIDRSSLSQSWITNIVVAVNPGSSHCDMRAWAEGHRGPTSDSLSKASIFVVILRHEAFTD
ncbi:hypothetical protein F5X98DRAFT_374377 [Xylaria grammica]|nr:hypothetical protein F5X98DRAFT_374377 [Xylaria grammica]